MKLIIRTFMVSLVAVAIFCSASASAKADGTALGTISVETVVGTFGTCNFLMSYTGNPITFIQLEGDSFQGAGAFNPCESTDISMGDINVSMDGFGPYTASLSSSWGFTAVVNSIFGDISCDFEFDPNAVVLVANADVLGPFGGSGEGESTNCFGLSVEVTFSNVTFYD